MSEETVITTSGLECLLESIKENESKYSSTFIHYIDQALQYALKLREIRKITSHSDEIAVLYSKIKENLKIAKKELK